MERLDWAVAAGKKLGKPVYVGEFQAPMDYAADSPEYHKNFTDFLAKLDRLQVPLASVWVFDYAPHEDHDGNITATNKRAWELSLVREHNKKVCEPRP